MKYISADSSRRDESNGSKIAFLGAIHKELWLNMSKFFLYLIFYIDIFDVTFLCIASRHMILLPLDSLQWEDSNELCFISLWLLDAKLDIKMSMQNMSYKFFFDIFSHKSLCIAPRNAILLPLDSSRREESADMYFIFLWSLDAKLLNKTLLNI